MKQRYSIKVEIELKCWGFIENRKEEKRKITLSFFLFPIFGCISTKQMYLQHLVPAMW